MVSSTLLVVTHQLFGVLLTAYHMVVDEVGQAESVRSVLVLEVQAMASFALLDTHALVLGVVLQHQLLKEEECPFVINFLSHLHLRLPQMWCVSPLAVLTLQISHHQFDNESLLQHRPRQHLLLHRELDLEPS